MSTNVQELPELEYEKIFRLKLKERYNAASEAGDREAMRIIEQMLRESSTRIRAVEKVKGIEKKRAKLAGKRVTNWGDLQGGAVAWADIEGSTHTAVDSDFGQSAKAAPAQRESFLLDSIDYGIEEFLTSKLMQVCTDTQRNYLAAYIWEDKTMQEIADEYGVCASSVCRAIQTAKKRIEDMVGIQGVTNTAFNNGSKLINVTKGNIVLWDNIKHIAAQILSDVEYKSIELRKAGYCTQAMIAEEFGVNVSTANRNLQRAYKKLEKHGIYNLRGRRFVTSIPKDKLRGIEED